MTFFVICLTFLLCVVVGVLTYLIVVNFLYYNFKSCFRYKSDDLSSYLEYLMQYGNIDYLSIGKSGEVDYIKRKGRVWRIVDVKFKESHLQFMGLGYIKKEPYGEDIWTHKNTRKKWRKWLENVEDELKIFLKLKYIKDFEEWEYIALMKNINGVYTIDSNRSVEYNDVDKMNKLKINFYYGEEEIGLSDPILPTIPTVDNISGRVSRG